MLEIIPCLLLVMPQYNDVTCKSKRSPQNTDITPVTFFIKKSKICLAFPHIPPPHCGPAGCKTCLCNLSSQATWELDFSIKRATRDKKT